jgi:hypothetical protein
MKPVFFKGHLPTCGTTTNLRKKQMQVSVKLKSNSNFQVYVSYANYTWQTEVQMQEWVEMVRHCSDAYGSLPIFQSNNAFLKNMKLLGNCDDNILEV